MRDRQVPWSPFTDSSPVWRGSRRRPCNEAIAFGGLADGLEYAAANAKWSRTGPRHFTATFQVPETAWLTPNGTHVLVDGSYSVAINGFVAPFSVIGCAQTPGQAEATFNLTQVPSAFAPQPYLRWSPSAAKPGETVYATGGAPLTEIIGVPFSCNLTWSQHGKTSSPVAARLTQSLTGHRSGAFRVPASNVWMGIGHVGISYLFTHDDATMAFAPTAMHVLAPLTWEELLIPKTVDSASNANPIAHAGFRVAMPSQTLGSFLARENGGRTWKAISATAITPIAEKFGYPTHCTENGGPEVSSVLLNADDEALMPRMCTKNLGKPPLPATTNVPGHRSGRSLGKTRGDGGTWLSGVGDRGRCVHDDGHRGGPSLHQSGDRQRTHVAALDCAPVLADPTLHPGVEAMPTWLSLWILLGRSPNPSLPKGWNDVLPNAGHAGHAGHVNHKKDWQPRAS